MWFFAKSLVLVPLQQNYEQSVPGYFAEIIRETHLFNF